jgi:hypothetical protein
MKYYRWITGAFIGTLFALAGSLALHATAYGKGVIGAEDGPWPDAFDPRPTAMTVYHPTEPRPENCEHKVTVVSCEYEVKWCVTPDGRYHKYWQKPSSSRDKRRLCKIARQTRAVVTD